MVTGTMGETEMIYAIGVLLIIVAIIMARIESREEEISPETMERINKLREQYLTDEDREDEFHPTSGNINASE